MRKKRRDIVLFKDTEQKRAILKNILEDYVTNDMSIKELADNYGYSARQIRYIINHYLCVKKGSGKKKMKEEIEKLDDGAYIINGKLC